MPLMKQKAREKAPPVVLGAGEPRHDAARREAGSPWRALVWFGLAILLVGVVDLALVWVPVRADNPAWEFGAIDRSVSTAPVLLVALGFLLASGLMERRRWLMGLVGTIAVGLALVTLVGLFVYWTAVPLALSNAPEAALAGVRKSMARTTVFGLTLLGASAASAVAALRVAFNRAERRKR